MPPGTLPFDPLPNTDLEIEGHAYEPGSEPEAEILTATPEYFRTMGMRPTVLVINQTVAHPF